MRYKLGRLPTKHHPNTLRLSKYLTGVLPTPAEKVYREYLTPAIAKQMFGNDACGDCTIAGIANLIILTTLRTGSIVIPALADVIAMYSALSGYDPATGANDNGCAMTDVLAYMQTTGLAGEKILGWAAIDITNLKHRQIACDVFGATYVGVTLPNAAQTQFGAGEPWEVVDGDTIEGGHAILRPGYGSKGDDYVSWAKWDQKASAAWSTTYVEEEYAIITPAWADYVSRKPTGAINLAALESDLALMKETL